MSVVRVFGDLMSSHLPPLLHRHAPHDTVPISRAALSAPWAYLSYREYLKTYEPTVFALLLDPERETFNAEYQLARKIAAERGERGLTFPGQSLTLYRGCVWSEVYRAQR